MKKIFILILFLAAASGLGASAIIPAESGDPAFRDELVSRLKAKKLNPKIFPYKDLPALLETAKDDILIIPDSARFPAESLAKIEDFVNNGNSLLTISGFPFSQPLIKSDSGYDTRDELIRKTLKMNSEPLCSFTAEDAKLYKAASSSKNTKQIRVTEPSGCPDFDKAFHLTIKDILVYETCGCAQMRYKPGDDDVLVVWAKGETSEDEMFMEVGEEDSSRWVTVLKLSPEWKRFVLFPSDFSYLDSHHPEMYDGHKRFNPSKITYVAYGAASSHNVFDASKDQNYWVSDLCSGKCAAPAVDQKAPVLETISPSYKLHRTVAKALMTEDGSKTEADIPVTSSILRPNGLGFGGIYDYRTVPVITTYNEYGGKSGFAAHIQINNLTKKRGTCYGHIAYDNDYVSAHKKEIASLAADMAARIKAGIFIANGGVEKFGYAEGEKILSGAYVNNFSAKDETVTLRTELTDPHGTPEEYEVTTVIPAGSTKKVVTSFTDAVYPGYHHVYTTLIRDGKIIDRNDYDFTVIDDTPRPAEEAVTVENGRFMYKGKPWYAVGLNYWQGNIAGLEPEYYFGLALNPYNYDPEVVERDMELMERMKMSCISVQYCNPEAGPALIDLLERAKNHDIKVHLYMDHCHPLWADPSFRMPAKMMKAAHLGAADAVFAYDLGWEVLVGLYQDRSKRNEQWQNWVIDRYGSIENAVSDWKYDPGRDENGFLDGPSDEQVVQDGEHNIFVAAYRRFWDDEISAGYRNVKNHVREFDKLALLCARSGYGGTGQIYVARFMPFDLMSGIRHLDMTSPEGYGLGGTIENFMKGSLNATYGRFVSANKPVLWAEAGISVYPSMSEKAMEKQGNYYDCMLRTVNMSGSDGLLGWWFLGGYRVDEKSDYGVTNPDGTPRLAMKVFEKNAEMNHGPRQLPTKPGKRFRYDRDEHASGYSDFYMNNCEEFSKIFLAGELPEIYTDGTGTDSANTPMIAVGNVPANGTNPPKYLNAEFDEVESAYTDGALTIKAVVGNTAEAKWLAGNKTGSVLLKASVNGKNYFAEIKSDTPYLGTALTEALAVPCSVGDIVTVKMTAKDRTDFGEVKRIEVR
ncbi:MAG: hypothetical protein J6U98_01295 [Abditibacteriota bacterium]|nr:hypothetical protein [Abditibacteriota bacterium]